MFLAHIFIAIVLIFLLDVSGSESTLPILRFFFSLFFLFFFYLFPFFLLLFKRLVFLIDFACPLCSFLLRYSLRRFFSFPFTFLLNKLHLLSPLSFSHVLFFCLSMFFIASPNHFIHLLTVFLNLSS